MLFAALLFCWDTSVHASSIKPETLELPATFVANAFGGTAPTPQNLWLTKDLQADIAKIMGHKLAGARLRYWQQGEKTAWILEEIGKEAPITAGFVIDNEVVTETNVLIYRENRGWEIKYPAFRNQFIGTKITEDMQLDTQVDGISGATMSVNAMIKMARLALFLHQHVQSKEARE